MDWQRLSHLTHEELGVLQNKQLRYFLKHQVRYSPYYRDLLKSHDLSPSDFRTTDDLVKLPFTTKEDIAPSEEDRGRPKRFMLQPDEHLIKSYAPKSELVKLLWKKMLKRDVKQKLEWEYKPIHLHFTTGRTALPTAFGYSARDLEALKETGRRAFEVAGIRREDVGINGFPYSPHLAFWLAYYGMTASGMTNLPTGGGKVMGTTKIIEAIERMKAAVVLFIPGYCYHLLREAVKQKRDFSSVTRVIFGGERVSPGLREKVKELLAGLGAHEVEILATYAMTEAKTAWIQCSETTGYHLYPDLEFFEVVDSDERRVQEGPGELVYTALDWRGSIVLRYKTGDMTKGIEYGECPQCGRTVPRILPDIQRSSDVREFNLIKLKGELINLNNFYPLLSGMKEVEEWQVVISKKNDDPFEVDELTLSVAVKSGIRFETFRKELAHRVQEAVNIGVTVQEKPLETILATLGMETELKEKRILDRRPKS